MSLSNEPDHGDQRLERYLLGLLPDDDAERLDYLSVADDQVAWQLRMVEDDLVDAYVSGELTGHTLERFESYYLSSERRRQKVRFARSFLASDRGAGPADTQAGCDSVRERAPERHSASPGGSPSTGLMVRSSKPAWKLAVAAALLVSACGPLLYQVVRLRSGLNEAQLASADLSRRARDLQQQLDDQRAANIEAKAAATLTDPKQAPPPRALSTIALVLLPQTRAIGPVATLAVPQDVDRVALELRLESNDFPRYQVVLTDPGTNRVVWRSDRIAAALADDVPTVLVTIPASALKAQHYSLEVDGLASARGAEVVGSYVFQMVRR